MKLPGADRSVVDSQKIREYLLSDTHPVGRFKAFFFKSLGYSAQNWQTLDQDLRRHAREHEATLGDVNPFGQKYEILGKLTGPAGNSAEVTAVWIILRGENFPRLVTAFPGNKP